MKIAQNGLYLFPFVLCTIKLLHRETAQAIKARLLRMNFYVIIGRSFIWCDVSDFHIERYTLSKKRRCGLTLPIGYVDIAECGF